MKHYFACILLLLMPVPFAAQVRQPTLQRSTQNDETNQKPPYAGRRIFSLEFRGNQHLSSETLREFMKTQVGEPYNADQLENDQHRLRVLLLGRNGYLKATVGTPEIEDTISGLRIVVPVQEGILYRWGTIELVGLTVFSPEEALKIIGLESGEIADGQGFQTGLSKLETLYRNRGYFKFNVGFIPDFKPASSDGEEGVVDVSCEIEESEAFRIDRIEFASNKRTSDRVVRRRLLIHEGDVYNDSLVRKSVARLNALGLFKELKPQDIAVHPNDDREQVDITIHLKEKGRE